MSAEDAGQQVDDAGQHEAPRGEEVQAAPPAVLIEDVEGAAGADRAGGVLRRTASRVVPAAMLVVAADRQLEERRRQVVARLAPVEPRVRPSGSRRR